MAINHAETSILIDGVDTRYMSDSRLAKTQTYLSIIINNTRHCIFNDCRRCHNREMQLDIVNMEMEARGIHRQEKGFTFEQA